MREEGGGRRRSRGGSAFLLPPSAFLCLFFMSRFNFPKSVRLLKSAEFDRVFSQRCSCSDGLIVVYLALRNPALGIPELGNPALGDSEQPRLGLVVSRKCGNAVVRNRWKRALREAFRLVQNDLPRNLDFVVLPQRRAKPDVVRLQDSFRQLAEQAARRLPKVREMSE